MAQHPRRHHLHTRDLENPKYHTAKLVLVFVQQAGRVHLRRDGAGVPGGTGLGLRAPDCRLLVRHDGIWRRLPQTLQVPRPCKQAAYGISRKRYALLLPWQCLNSHNTERPPRLHCIRRLENLR